MYLKKIDLFFESLMKNKKMLYGFFIFVSIIFSLLAISRRVDSVTYPQFWAEDGATWYANAYSMGPLKPFFIPVSGYFQTISRITASLSLFLPLHSVPLFFNLIALVIQVLPAIFFLSKRFEKVIESFGARFLISLAYLGFPSTFETHLNLSNSQWRLAILIFLIMIAKPSSSKAWKIFDGLLLAVAGLSGPFSIMLMPVFCIYYYLSKNKSQQLLNFFIVLTTGFVQFVSVLFEIGSHARGQINLGISALGFSKIFAGKVVISSLLGARVYNSIWRSSWWNDGYATILVTIIAIALLGYVLKKAELELKLFIIYSYLVFSMALIFPMVSSADMTEWDAMLRPFGGNRYFLLPMLGFIVSIVWIFARAGKAKCLKYFTTFLLGMFIFIGIPFGWIIAPYKDFNFSNQAKQFEAFPLGKSMDFKINPGWTMTLIKK